MKSNVSRGERGGAAVELKRKIYFTQSPNDPPRGKESTSQEILCVLVKLSGLARNKPPDLVTHCSAAFAARNLRPFDCYSHAHIDISQLFKWTFQQQFSPPDLFGIWKPFDAGDIFTKTIPIFKFLNIKQ